MKSHARVVVIGGGVAGCSLLYHLTRLGWSDVVLVDKGELTSGSTWHAAGLCTQFNMSLAVTKLLMYSVNLYQSLEAETGQPVGFHRVGSVRLATTRDRLDQYRHARAKARILGLPFELIGPPEIKAFCPILSLDGILGAAYTPTDGYIDPSSVTRALAKGARDRGAVIYRQTRVTGLRPTAGGGWEVVTDQGTIIVEIVVNAAGLWGRAIGEMAGVSLPIIPMEHQYLITDAVPDLAGRPREMPVVRDVERSFYLRQELDGLLLGVYETNPLPWAVKGIPPEFGQQLLPPNLPQIQAFVTSAKERVPVLAEAGIRRIVNGPVSYTPDGNCLMGEVPGLRNYYVLAGFSYGIVQGGGAGRYAAEWIVEGRPSDDVGELDVRRFGPYAAATPYTVARACEVYEREYAVPYPHQEEATGRPLKTDPLYDLLKMKGAVFGARSGWECPLWFAPRGVEPVDELTFHRPNWFARVGAECRLVRERVGVLDQTSFAKYEISGPGAAAFLSRLCANALPSAPGTIGLTPMLNAKGGIECAVSVTRLGPDRFYVISPAISETHDLAWMERHCPANGRVTIENVTSRYGVLTVAGPRARALLQGVSADDFSNAAFPFLTARDVYLGSAPVRAMRISSAGELGWELHHPIEYQRYLYDLLVDGGRPFGLVDFGERALESMRLEKGYRRWGTDISSHCTPYEAGLGHLVTLDKGDFLGRDALLRQKGKGVQRTLACLTIETDDALPYGAEPIFAGDEVVSGIASGGYGHLVRAAIGLAYLPVKLAGPGTRLEVEILGERCPAVVVDVPLYDPENSRLEA